ncbi:MAG: orotidine-5'-phosphate decarboxylase [Candidatus Woykebacteria bacterium]
MEKISARILQGAHLCLGVDPDLGKIPAEVSVTEFCQRSLERSLLYAAAIKPNIAFFEERGSEGLKELELVIRHVRSLDPGVPIILDMKRGDIGKTNSRYIKEAFDLFGVDAVTVHPYLGRESLSGFLAEAERGIIILCRTSNPGAGEFQDLTVDVSTDPVLGQDRAPLYQVVARNVSRDWDESGNCGLVVGAVYPNELAKVREIAPSIFLLIPGVGTQSGDLRASVGKAYNPNALADFVINVSSRWSSAYLTEQFKADPKHFDKAAAKAADFYDQQIRSVLESFRTMEG